MTTQAVPFAGLDAGQLAVQQATLRVQAELAEELAAEPALRLPEEERASLRTRLEREVLEPGELYGVAQRLGQERAALLLLRCTNYADAEAARQHWSRLLREIVDGEAPARCASWGRRWAWRVGVEERFHQTRPSSR